MTGSATAWLLVALAALCWPGRPVLLVDAPGEPAAGARGRRDRPGDRGHPGRQRGRRRARRGSRTPRVRALAVGSTARGGSRRQSQVVVLGALAAGTLAVAALGWPALPVAILAAPAVADLLGRAQRRARSPADPGLPLALDLAAAVLRSGQPLSQALRLGAPVTGTAASRALVRVAGLLELGTDPVVAWREVDQPALAPVVAAGCRSADSGLRLATGLEQVAADLRRAARADAVTRGQRAGVVAMAPLGLCFLPGFICLGVVPVIVGIAGAAFAGAG